MGKKKEFGEGALFTIFNYVWWFLLASFYFAITNILFIFVWFITNAEGGSIFNIVTVVALIPTGPALVALFSVMEKIVREKDIEFTKSFFKAYKDNFLEVLFYWTVFIGILSISYADIIYINSNAKNSSFAYILVSAKFILLAVDVILISTAFYLFPIISRLYFKKKDAIKVAMYYAIKKLHITILNWFYLIGLAYVVINISSPVFIFLFFSVLCYLIIINEKSIIKGLVEKCEGFQENVISVD